MSRTNAIIIGLILFVAIIWLANSVTSVKSGHLGVVTSFGKVGTETLPEGIHFIAFWKKVHNRSIMQQRSDGESACFSSDLQQVYIKYAILWRQPQDKVIELYRLYQADVFIGLIQSRIEESMKQITALYPAQEIAQQRMKIKNESVEMLKSALGDLVIIDDLNLLNIDLSEELEKSIESKMVMEQQSLAKKYELDKERKDAEIIVVRAKASAESINITGDALAKNPKVIQYEIVKKWNGITSYATVIGSGVDGVDILLPVAK